MHDNNKILIISDIEPFINNSLTLVIEIGKKYNIKNNEIDYFFDWVVNQILTTEFDLKVIHHYRHDIYICIYSEIHTYLIKLFRHSVNIIDLNILKGQEVKTLINGRDLFITKRTFIKLN